MPNDGGRDAERTLVERARQLAQVPSAAPEAEAEVVLFRLGNEQHAIELGLLREVQPARGLTALPCTPPHVAGILNVRGEVVTVVDLAQALGLPRTSDPAGEQQVLLVDAPQGRFGFLVTEVLGVYGFPREKLDPSLSGSDLALGVAQSRVVFLNLEQLLSSGRLDVLEEVS